MIGCHVRDAQGKATMLVMPNLDLPGAFILRIQGEHGDGAICLDPAPAEEVARTIMAAEVDGAWLEEKLRDAFRAGAARQAWQDDPVTHYASQDEDQYVAAELAKVRAL